MNDKIEKLKVKVAMLLVKAILAGAECAAAMSKANEARDAARNAQEELERAIDEAKEYNHTQG